MATVLVAARMLKAALRICPKADIRYYLNGVLIEATATETIAVTTDGHRLLAVRQEAQNEVQEPVSLLMPHWVAKLLTAGRPNKYVHVLDLRQEEGRWSAPLPQGGRVIFEPIEQDGAHRFPAWRRVIPTECTGVPAQFNPKYLLDMTLAAKDLGAVFFQTARLTPNGEHAAGLVTCPQLMDYEFLGAVMPIRDDSAPNEVTVPTWAVPPTTAKEPGHVG
ncbi:hypothetical protein [Allopusillimonas ginsengisoli]|uniref:DNA polymerase III subunit beta family protein n=1 Tax=Allopusillimonas ginsengisoli TaxID=453575 RepID=UPI00101F80DA|nr:hypothetical protein [Allopusillimonas ginsengisoli]TEA79804.1 hypothetical protein ERE07_02360 [Allopusillimonas ginsengisoli]